RFYTEYLDLSWFPTKGQERQLGRLMKQKYAGRNIDLVMACGDAALRFALRERASLFPDVPIVFCAGEYESIRDARLAPDVTGVTMLVDWTAGVELALRLEPRTQRVVFVGGTGPTERVWEGLARQAFSKFENRVTFSYLSGLPMSEILTAVATLPKGTVAVLGAFLRDAAGRTFTTQEALSLLAGASTAPIYRFGERLRFETLLSDLCAGFLKIRADEADQQIEGSLRRIVEDLGVDRASLGVFTAESLIRVTHSWTREGIAPVPRVFEAAEFPWITGRLRDGHVVSFSRPDELPDEAVTDRSAILAFGTTSVVLVPFIIGGAAAGALAVSMLRVE